MATRGTVHESFRQTRHGETSPGGQTPAYMFLEAIHVAGLREGSDRIATIERSRGGKYSVGETCTTREEILSQVLLHVDGHLTAYEDDDYSVRLIVLDPDPSCGGRRSRLAWVELLHEGSHGAEHPELTDPELSADARTYSIR